MPRNGAARLAVLLLVALPLCASAGAGLRGAESVAGGSPAAAAPAIQDGRYGPVQPTDTLWSIAERVRPSPAYTVQQTMLAIMDVNPGAFSRPNVNALETGVMLKIPTAEQVGRRSRAEALAEVKRQYAQWAARASQAAKTPVTRAAAPTPAAGTAGRQGSVQGTVPGGSGRSGAPAATASEARKLSALRSEVQAVTAQAEAAKARTQALATQVKNLEGEAGALKQSVQERESTLARLREQVTGSRAAPVQAIRERAAPAAAAPPPAPARATKEMTAPLTAAAVPPQPASLPKMASSSAPPRTAVKPAAAEDPLAVVDRILQKLPSANIAFNTPQALNVDDTAMIQLVMGVATSVEQLKRMITAAGAKESARIKVADRVEARLSGAGFTITAITPEVQAVSGSAPTEWKWDVRPVATGSQVLHLTVSVLLDVNGSPTRRAIRTFDRPIQVQVTATQRLLSFAEGNWQWLWAAILVPVAGYAWRRWRRGGRRRRA